MSILTTPPWVPAKKLPRLALTVPTDRPESISPFTGAHHGATQIPAENDKYAERSQAQRDEEILGLIAERGILPIYAARYLSESATVVALEKADLRFLTHYRIPQIALERFGTRMIAPLTEAFVRAPEPVHETFLAVDSIRVAELYIDEFASLGGAWFSRHPETAALVMIPIVMGSRAKESARVLKAIAALLREGHREAVNRAAACYEVEEELERLLLPPSLPPKPPELPAFLDISTLPVPIHGDHPLAPEPFERLLQLLALLPLGAARDAVLTAKRELEPASLGVLSRALVDRWTAAEAPTSDRWVLLAAATLGDDLVAHQLATNVATWAELGQHTRAMAGVEALRHLGSNVALAHLSRFATKSKHGAVKRRARASLSEYREEHHLSEDELADRLVPAVTSSAREAKLTLDVQVRRLEKAMNKGRRWSREEFDRYLREHPLMQQLARRLLWGAFDEHDALATTFRIAEDNTLSNVDDETTSASRSARFGIVHPFVMSAELASQWGNVFGDYEIVQPFPQLAREVRRLTDTERETRVIHRFEGRVVDGRRFFSLPHRGWTFLDYDLGKVVSGGRFVVLETEPGVELLTSTPADQTLGVVSLRSPVPGETFASASELEMSEVLRDVEMLLR